ncbi:MAG TPA: SusC/RagA family TonB-linked outer membrane protein [Flavobacterium sp.]|nr:SusC/RagA family TonB-linked outer membrane protein [Flavobacterium sp.]
MRSKFKWIFSLLLAFSMQFSFAQEKTVSGTVTDGTLPLPGVTVAVKGTARTTQTDFDGKYSIAAKQGEVLEFTYIGFKTATAPVGASSSVNVALAAGTTELETVVVDSYRSTSKRKSATAVNVVTAEAVQGRPNVSFLQSLQGQVSGLNIATSSGSPGSAKISVLLRGASSINGNTEPLYVIDGIPSSVNIFRGLNNEDIESVTTLKDAGATAIYGNRGANGVIVVKTKRGTYNSKLKVRYSTTTGYNDLPYNDYDLTDAKQTLTLENQVGVGLGSTLTQDEINNWSINTNWRDYFFRTGVTKSHNLSFTQGGENTTNFTSLSYFDQQGIVPNTDFKRFTFRTNFTGKSANEKFTYTTSFLGGYSKRNQLEQEIRFGTNNINSNVLQNPLQGLLASLPYLDPNVYVNGRQLFDEFGAPSFEITPYMLLDYLKPGNIPSSFQETKLLANATGTYKFTDALSFTTNAGFDYVLSQYLFARAPQSYLAIIATPAGAEFGGLETQNTDREVSFNFVNSLSYNKVFNDKHTLDLSVFTEYIKAHRNQYSATTNGLDPRTYSPGAGTGLVPFNPATPTLYNRTFTGLKRDAGLFSYFGTASYDYDAKYGIEATIRRDASYRFIQDNTWGTFWSVAGRWNIDQEAFMANSSFDILKLRGSYGTTGNQNILVGNPGVNPLFLGNNLVRDLSSSQTGYGNASSTGVILDADGNPRPANPNLQWETTTQANIGLDFTFKKRLSGTIDFYRKKTTDLFDSDYISAANGVYDFDANINASLINTGVELLLRYDVFNKSDFKLDVFVNGSYNKNEYADLTYPDPANDFVQTATNNAQQNGQPFNTFFVVPYIGVNPANGNLLFLDRNNNVTENPTNEDRRITGKSYIPVYQGGFGLNASYKGFFINSAFSFVSEVYKFDFDLLNLSNPVGIGTGPVVSELTNAWSPTNTGSDVPSLTATNIDAGDTFSDRFLRDASYLRMRNLAFGYDVPAKLLDKTLFSGVRIFGQLENYFTWTKWRGFDPENLANSNQGGYPTQKVISFGLDLQF